MPGLRGLMARHKAGIPLPVWKDNGCLMTPSGKLQLRMPVDLHGHLSRLAEQQGVSLNTLIISLLAGGSHFKLKKET